MCLDDGRVCGVGGWLMGLKNQRESIGERERKNKGKNVRLTDRVAEANKEGRKTNPDSGRCWGKGDEGAVGGGGW